MDLPGAGGSRLFIEKICESALIEEQDLNHLLNDNKAGYLVLQQEDA